MKSKLAKNRTLEQSVAMIKLYNSLAIWYLQLEVLIVPTAEIYATDYQDKIAKAMSYLFNACQLSLRLTIAYNNRDEPVNPLGRLLKERPITALCR